MASARPPLKLAVAGLGAIGLAVARRVDAGELPGMVLIAAAARDHDKARKATTGFRAPPPMTTLAGLAEVADVIVECLPAAHFAAVAEPAVANGPHLHAAVGRRAARPHAASSIARAETGARIIVPTGALLGLDAVRAAAEGKISSVTIVTRKPPAGLAGAPLLAAARHFGGRASRRRCGCSKAARARPSPASPPTSTWRSRCRLPASARIARGSRSGPTRA